MTARRIPVALVRSLTCCAAVAAFTAFGPAGAAWAQPAEAKASPPRAGATTAEIVLRKTAELYKNARSFAFKFSRSQKVGELTLRHTYTVAFQRPNRLAVRSNGPEPGIDIISDGNTMFASDPDFGYTEAEAPATIEAIFSDPNSEAGLHATMLPELCAAEPYGRLMQGVKTATYSGLETLDGARAHHLKLTKDEFDCEIWVAADGDPLVRRVVVDLAKTMARSPFAGQFKGQKMDLIQDYKDWQPRSQLNVDVWQILVGGKKPERLPGSQNDKIVVETVTTETSPLAQAVQKNDLKAVEALLTKGADAKVKDSVGRPVLITAAKHGSGSIVEALLKKGADVNARSEEGSTALLEAIDADHLEIVKMLLAARADVNKSHEGGLLKGVTPLIDAAMMGKEDIVQTLLEHGADVKAKSNMGLTALAIAKVMGQAKGKDYEGIIRRLQQAGAKP